MDGFNLLDSDKNLYENVYVTKDHKMVTVRIDKDGFMTFEGEKERN